jgi:UDP-D-galactose:(glucosyl)LPS alpha-1,3-D-galactosyltransferase
MERAAGGMAKVRSVIPALPRLPDGWSKEAGHVSDAMYLRLGLVEALPDHVERLLYLDCDTLVTGSLSPLVSVDLVNAPLAAVRDAFTRRVVDRGGLPGWQGYPPMSGQDPYFNSGVLLIDTASWRRLDVSDRALGYLLDNAGKLRYPDQDALNVACAGQWTRLPSRWNHMMPWRLESANGGRLSDAVIAHCAGPRKWWSSDYPSGDFATFYRSMVQA